MKTAFTSTGTTSTWTEENTFTITTTTSRIVKDGDGWTTINESSTKLSTAGIVLSLFFLALSIAASVYLISQA